MRVLLRNHGVNLSGVKSDLYTTIGQLLVSLDLYTVFIVICLQELIASTQVGSLLQYVSPPSKLSGMLRILQLRYGKIIQFCLRKNRRYSFSLYLEINVLKYIQELKDAFFAELGQNKPAPIDNPAGSDSPVAKVATTTLPKGKGKPKLKKKASDDPFASDNDNHEDGTDSKVEKEKPKQNTTSKNPTAKQKRSNDDEDEDVKAKKKRIT